MIKKILLAAAALLILAGGCKKDSSISPQLGKDDASFATYENSFLEGLWKLEPDRATLAGYHKYDSLLLAPDNKNRYKLLNYAKVQLDSLSRFEVTTLNAANKIDYQIMQNQMQWTEWKIQQLRSYQWDPGTYNITKTFAYILNQPYAPLQKRLQNFYEKMANIPAYYKEAEKQVKNPVNELAELAEDQLTAGTDLFEKDFEDSLKKANIPQAEQAQMTERAHTATGAIKEFTEWLKALKNDHPASFRLSKDLYADKFKYELQSELSPQQLYNAAVEQKKSIQHDMLSISKKMWPKYFGSRPMPADSLDLIAQVIDTISANHVQAAQLQRAIEKTLPKLTAFVRAKDLLTPDPSKQIIVRKEPGYMAGVTGASVSLPGPYDKNGVSYFNVSNLSGWPPESAESYLRQYNNYMLQMLCIREAIPGRYLQHIYANNAPSVIKSVFGNRCMVDGWAAYSELMMLDNGYGNGQPELTLMGYKSHLRWVCNAILDYGVHNNNMSKQDGLKLLMHEGFQQQAEAARTWHRVTVSSVQLEAGFVGCKEIIDLREAYKKKMADKYTLKDFNEKFLSYGSAPVMYIKEAMLAKEAQPAN